MVVLGGGGLGRGVSEYLDKESKCKKIISGRGGSWSGAGVE